MRAAPAPKCRKFDCLKPSAPRQVYCCKEHSPYGHLYDPIENGATKRDREEKLRQLNNPVRRNVCKI